MSESCRASEARVGPRPGHADLSARERRTDFFIRSYLTGLAITALVLGAQFAVMAWIYLDPARMSERTLWLNPGLACLTGFSVAALVQGLRVLMRRRTIA